MKRTWIGSWIAIALLAGTAAHGGAQVPAPAPAPSPPPNSFTAHGHTTVTVTSPAGPFEATAQLGLAQSGTTTRVDVLSVRSSALPIRIENLTFVVDHRAGTVTIWSDTTKAYYVQSLFPRIALASPSPTPAATAPASPSPRPARTPRSALADLEIFSVTMRLLNHTTTVGIPTTGLALDMEMRKKGETATSRITATMQLADEFAIFPVAFDATIAPGAAPFGGKLSYAIDDLVRTVPPQALFETPAGFRQAASPFEVLLGTTPRRPITLPSPR